MTGRCKQISIKRLMEGLNFCVNLPIPLTSKKKMHHKTRTYGKWFINLNWKHLRAKLQLSSQVPVDVFEWRYIFARFPKSIEKVDLNNKPESDDMSVYFLPFMQSSFLVHPLPLYIKSDPRSYLANRSRKMSSFFLSFRNWWQSIVLGRIAFLTMPVVTLQSLFP